MWILFGVGFGMGHIASGGSVIDEAIGTDHSSMAHVSAFRWHSNLAFAARLKSDMRRAMANRSVVQPGPTRQESWLIPKSAPSGM
jgi:hypothetical protein